MLLTAINQRDYALRQGTVLVVAILFVSSNTLRRRALWLALDPRSIR
jgi:ABC-type dipeptide/oligopeptide/nickel transport system permease component